MRLVYKVKNSSRQLQINPRTDIAQYADGGTEFDVNIFNVVEDFHGHNPLELTDDEYAQSEEEENPDDNFDNKFKKETNLLEENETIITEDNSNKNNTIDIDEFIKNPKSLINKHTNDNVLSKEDYMSTLKRLCEKYNKEEKCSSNFTLNDECIEKIQNNMNLNILQTCDDIIKDLKFKINEDTLANLKKLHYIRIKNNNNTSITNNDISNNILEDNFIEFNHTNIEVNLNENLNISQQITQNNIEIVEPSIERMQENVNRILARENEGIFQSFNNIFNYCWEIWKKVSLYGKFGIAGIVVIFIIGMIYIIFIKKSSSNIVNNTTIAIPSVQPVPYILPSTQTITLSQNRSSNDITIRQILNILYINFKQWLIKKCDQNNIDISDILKKDKGSKE